ncbi:MAG TPA: hypothetical protein VN961_04850, partial [Streptosporangiaceae bacterium]|nr:hypothetical protein [Streptosporangiaceae bacterium]
MRLRAGHIRIAVAAPLAVVAAIALASCSASGTGSGSAGGVLHIGTTYPIDSMNPFVAQSD